MQIDIIFGLVVLIFSVILHEVAHGHMANWLGDPTARLAGRLTLNPISHIDPMGSVLLPLILATFSPIVIGYAKPVPYNPYNLRGKYAEGLVAFAGPGTNILIAVIFGLLIRVAPAQLGPDLIAAFKVIVIYNVVLAIFNLIPIPPLDGSKVLSSIFLAISPRLENAYDKFRLNFERLGVFSGILLILAIFYLFRAQFLVAVIWITSLLTGASI